VDVFERDRRRTVFLLFTPEIPTKKKKHSGHHYTLPGVAYLCVLCADCMTERTMRSCSSEQVQLSSAAVDERIPEKCEMFTALTVGGIIQFVIV